MRSGSQHDINLKGHGIAQAVAHCSVGGQRDCLRQTFSKFFKFEDSNLGAHQQLRSGKNYEERVTTWLNPERVFLGFGD
jgi:hypothetical protein